MKMNTGIITVIVGLFITCGASAKTVRATDLGSDVWAQLSVGSKSELVVEFRSGDELPVSFSAEGDFLETSQTGVSYVKIKRDFWIKLVGNDVQLSLDNVSYKPIQDVVKGSFSAGANAGNPGGPANAINLVLSAYLK